MKASPPSPRPCRPSTTDADARSPEVRRPHVAPAHVSSMRIESAHVATCEQLNLAGRIANSIRFPFQRFHVLFNSLFKVLFIFPSRYLFAIGLVPVFSFRWSLPPVLGCIPKQPDSSKAHRERSSIATYGVVTLCDVLFQAT